MFLNIFITICTLKSGTYPSYNLDGIGRKDERFCIELIGNDGVVYFAERGTRTTEEKFNTEDDVCKYLIEQLID